MVWLFVLCLLVAPCVGSHASQAQELADFVGTFAYVPEQSESIDAAIDAGVAKANFVVRHIARSRLRKTNYAYGRLAFWVDGDTLCIQMDQRQPIRVPTSGAAVSWRREDGEIFAVSARLVDKALVQEYVAEDGQRLNTFVLDDGGSVLHMHVTVRSPKLEDDVVYRLTYRRTTGEEGQ